GAAFAEDCDWGDGFGQARRRKGRRLSYRSPRYLECVLPAASDKFSNADADDSAVRDGYRDGDTYSVVDIDCDVNADAKPFANLVADLVAVKHNDPDPHGDRVGDALVHADGNAASHAHAY